MSDVLIVYPDGTDKPGVEFKCANGFVSRVVSAVAQQNIPDAERVCQILNSADAELTSVKARLVARSKAMLWMRDVLINIRDELETDVDRVFFGSTNDADDFREVVGKLDDWQWSVIMKDAEGEDLYAKLRAARARISSLEALCEEARVALEPFAAVDVGDSPDDFALSMMTPDIKCGSLRRASSAALKLAAAGEK